LGEFSLKHGRWLGPGAAFYPTGENWLGTESAFRIAFVSEFVSDVMDVLCVGPSP
jgi:hypothetical protein